MSGYPLLDRWPVLRERVPVAGLLSAPTPVARLGDDGLLYFKRDDLSAPDYGGNKVRKLDFLLAGARAAGAGEVVSFGYAGSNFVAATAWHARKLGLRTFAFLLPQVPASYVADNLAVSIHAGAELRQLDSTQTVAAAATLRSLRSLLAHGRWPYWIPPGGSAPLGVLGFVNAALELDEQIRRGEVPKPESIYIAFSSMGSVAGLAIGLLLAGRRSRIVAVQVVDARFACPQKLKALVMKTLALLRPLLGASLPTIDAILERIVIRTEFFGEEYAKPTPATLAAIARFEAASGARADSAYTGKALAGLYADLDAGALRGKSALFWHTFNAHGRPPRVALPAPSRIPDSLHGYFVR